MSEHERPQVGSLALDYPSLTFIAGVRLSAIVVVNFINGPWLTVRAVTARRYGKETHWGAFTLTLPLASLRQQPSPLPGLDPDRAQARLTPSFPFEHPWTFLPKRKPLLAPWLLPCIIFPGCPQPWNLLGCLFGKVVNAKVFCKIQRAVVKPWLLSLENHRAEKKGI